MQEKAETSYFVTTDDGSRTIYNPGIGEHYHSKFGALRESRHVFIQEGLEYLLNKETGSISEIKILEVGFGTGLNFLLTADFCNPHNLSFQYTGIEAYPLSKAVISSTGYDQYITAGLWKLFIENYRAQSQEISWNNGKQRLQLAICELLAFKTDEQFDLLYFDAFAVTRQPEMWSNESLEYICTFLKPGGIFVTYAITGNLKRTMKSLGFSIEKVQGAPGKREMLRATKL